MKIVLITGSNGAIGQSLCHGFKNDGYYVIAIIASSVGVFIPLVMLFLIMSLIIPAKKDRLTELVKQDDMSAVRVPNNIIARTISRQLGKPIVATSANMSGKDTCYNIESVTSSLEDNLNEIEYIIDFGELNKGELSTIIKISDNEVETVREGIIKIK